ncbi:MAG: extracellular solute-binding protein [Chloroflexi bacterium]|nr:extracellular solute-binding protein [Chloroflexota bacterium]
MDSLLSTRRLSRASFLTAIGTVAAATLLQACAPAAPPTSTPAPRPTEAPKPAAPAAATPTPAPAKPAEPAAPAKPTAAPAPKPAGPQPTATPLVRAAGSGVKTALKFYTVAGGNSFKNLVAAMEVYESKHPGVGVELVYTPATAGAAENPKLMTALAGGQPPDISYIGDFTIPQWWLMGYITDLRGHFQRDKLSLDMFWPSLRKSMGYKGGIAYIPIQINPVFMQWNKKIFREAGLDPEKGPETVGDMDRFQDSLTKKDADGRVTRVGFVPWVFRTTPGNTVTTFGFAFGATFADEDKELVTAEHPGLVEAMQWVEQHTRKIGGPEKLAVTPPGLLAPRFAAGNVGIDSNNAPMLKQILDFAPNIEYGTGPIPKKPGVPGNPGWAGGWTLFQPKGVKNVDAAWDVMRWIGAEEEGTWLHWQATRDMTGRMSGLRWVENARQDKLYSPFVTALETMTNTRPLIPVSNFYYTQMNAGMEDIAYGRKTAAQALKDIQQNVTREWQRFKNELG